MALDRQPDAAQSTSPRGAETLASGAGTSFEVMQGLRRERDRLLLLHEAGSQLARSLDEPTILRTLARHAGNLIPGAAVLVHRVDESGAATPRVYVRDDEERDPSQAPEAMRDLGMVAAETQRVAAWDGRIAVPALLAGSVAAALVVQPAPG